MYTLTKETWSNQPWANIARHHGRDLRSNSNPKPSLTAIDLFDRVETEEHARRGGIGSRKHDQCSVAFAQLTGKPFPVLVTARLIRRACRKEAAARREEACGVKRVNWRRGVARQLAEVCR